MGFENLNWQQPQPWEDCEPRLWLRDNLSDYNTMSEYVRETEEFKQGWQKIVDAVSASESMGLPCTDCHPKFPEWLWSIGCPYIQDFAAQEVLSRALKEEIYRHGYFVDETGFPDVIVKQHG